jgi:hypothetical protein
MTYYLGRMCHGKAMVGETGVLPLSPKNGYLKGYVSLIARLKQPEFSQPEVSHTPSKLPLLVSKLGMKFQVVPDTHSRSVTFIYCRVRILIRPPECSRNDLCHPLSFLNRSKVS